MTEKYKNILAYIILGFIGLLIVTGMWHFLFSVLSGGSFIKFGINAVIFLGAGFWAANQLDKE